MSIGGINWAKAQYTAGTAEAQQLCGPLVPAACGRW
jgi:hypothetical protein